MLRARGVTRAFPVSGGKFWALRGIDADIPAGALVQPHQPQAFHGARA